MQRAQDMIVGAGIVGGMIGTIVGGVIWIINPEVDGNGAAFFGILFAAIAFTVIYLGWARPANPPPSGPRDLSPAPEDMPGAGTRASRLAIGAPAPAAAPAPKATAPAAVAAPEATAEPTPAEGPAEVSEHEGAGSPDAGKPEAAGEHMRPAGLDAPRGGAPDDLKKIKGVGPKLEKLVHAMGYYHFDQIAAWSSAEIAWVDDNLEGFKGRVTRDEWVSQAAILAVVGETGLATEG